MKEYRSSANDIVASVNNYELRATPITTRTPKVTSVAPSNQPLQPIGFNLGSQSSVSRSSLLTSSSLSIPQTHNFDYWPEFQENYNSIMDNTNLLDSCAAAMSDITGDDDRSCSSSSATATKLRGKYYNQSILFETSSSAASTSGADSTSTPKSISAKCIERFTRWLCDMEKRVARQPTLSQIFAMDSAEMAMQLKVHSKIFNDIVAQPCIVKGSERNDYKSIEERYHLLYLKAYEVLLLLEGLPNDGVANSNKILSRSYNDFNMYCDSVNEADEMNLSRVMNDDKLDAVDGDKNECVNSTAIYTQTNVKSANLGTYYFKYDSYDSAQPHEQLTNVHDSFDIADGIVQPFGDNELTFTSFYGDGDDHDLQSLLNATDGNYLNSNEYTLVANGQLQPIQQHLNDETVYISQNSQLWREFNFPELMRKPTLPLFEDASWPEQVTNAHSKVQNWLYFKTDAASYSIKSKSSLNLGQATSSENDYQMLYRTKSDTNLYLNGLRRNGNRSTSFQTSINRLPSMSISLTEIELQCDQQSEVNSMEWDNFQHIYGSQHSDECIGNDTPEMGALTRSLCEFGNDYFSHLTLPSLSVLTIDDDTRSDVESAESLSSTVNSADSAQQSKDISAIDTETTAEVLAMPKEDITIGVEEKNEKKKRRNRTKRSKKRESRKQHSLVTSDSSQSIAELSDTATSTTASTLTLSSHAVESIDKSEISANESKPLPEPQNPFKRIKYDSAESKFEFYSNESAEPKKHKVSELRPEDFHDIIKMCQNNIDCVITVLGADPNRVLTVAYCKQMKLERNQQKEKQSTSTNCSKGCVGSCKSQKTMHSQSTSTDACDCLHPPSFDTCLCAWISQTIAMILNFLIDCWNIFRNMRLYTYLCRMVKSLFGSTRYVADHLKSKRQLVSAKALKYS